MNIGEKTMKNLRSLMLALTVLTAGSVSICSAAALDGASTEVTAPKIAVVNFKTCVEKSKMGQQEQSNFDAMKKQMETVLLEKEKALNEIASKFNDIDYLDSLSPEAETELKNKFRTLNQEFSQQQNQFYQSLSQTNLQVVQRLSDAITKASAEVAKKNQIDLVLNEESSFFISPKLDISDQIIQVLNDSFEKDSKEPKKLPTQLETPK